MRLPSIRPRLSRQHARRLEKATYCHATSRKRSWTAAFVMAACGGDPTAATPEGGSAQGEDSATGGTGSSLTRSTTAGRNSIGGANPADTSGGSSSGGDTTVGRSSYIPVAFIVSPTLTPNKNGAAPLSAIIRAQTNVPTTGYARVSSSEESWDLALDSLAAIHERALLGVKPDTDYEVTVSVTNGNEEVVAPTLRWRTPALPDDFPRLQFVQSDPSRMQPGMTLFDVRSQQYVVVVDDRGQVRWYYRAPRLSDRFRLISNGNIAYVSPDSYLTEIDWLGNPVATWFAAKVADAETPPSGAISVDVGGFHHNFDEMPNGNLLSLCRDYRYIDAYPTSAEDPNAETQRTNVHGDEVVEFTRAGEVVKRYSLFNVLDPTRVGYVDFGSGIEDWSHSNSVIYDAKSDAYLVSVRHQDAVAKIARSDGELIWILGNHANWGNAWRPKLLPPLGSEFEWQYHQHAVELTPGGIGLYDNGNFGAPAYESPKRTIYSRAVRFAIDEQAMTVTQLWTYQPKYRGSPLYSPAMSDADWQPNGNVLIASGTLRSRLDPPGWAHIVEVTDDGEPIFELNVVNSPYATTFDVDRIPDIRYFR